VETVLQLENISLNFGSQKILNGITLTVTAGQVVALLGPNGAGKTSTIESIVGLHKLSGGNIQVLNCDPIKDRKQLNVQVGFQLQHGLINSRLKCIEALTLFEKIHPQSFGIDRLIELLNLKEFLNKYFGNLSGGQQQRLMLALAFIKKPRFVILDEPTSDSDPQSKHLIWDFLKHYSEQGGTLLFCTHNMEEALTLANSVAIIDQGKILVQATPQALIDTYASPHMLEAKLTSQADEISFDGIRSYKTHFIENKISYKLLKVFFSDEQATNAVLDRLRQHQYKDSPVCRATTLEDVYLLLTGKHYI